LKLRRRKKRTTNDEQRWKKLHENRENVNEKLKRK